MKKLLIVVPLAALLLSACILSPSRHGSGMVLAPALPPIVELDVEPFYFQSGYYYHYDNNNWRYSKSRSGPWAELPRSHYPKETKFKRGSDRRDKDHDRDHDRDRDRDHDRRDRR